MGRLVWRGILARKLRATLTAIAILLGVAMITGTYVLTDQIDAAFEDIFATANKGIDVIVSPREAFESRVTEPTPLDESLVDRVRRVDGVAVAAGTIEALGSLVVDGKYVETTGAPTLVVSNVPNPLSPGRYEAGRAPARTGEVAVDAHLADRESLKVGQQVGLATRVGVRNVRITGIFSFGDAASLGGATVVVTTFRDAQRWFEREGKVSTIVAAAEEGVTPDELARRVAAVLPPSARVQTGQQNAQEQADDLTEQINSFLGPALLAFAGVAIFVGAFIIFNTFSITVAQRLREIGMLRTIGATRAQVMVSVIGEAVAIGAGASLVGLAAGIGFAKVLVAAFSALGFDLPTAGLPVALRTIVVALAVGILVSLIAAVIPAVRATRVPPVAAMREGAVLPPSRLSRFTPYLGGLVGVVGMLLLVRSLFGEGSATSRLLGMALGAMLVFVSVAVFARYAVGPLARAVGWPLERVAGGTGRLARENATRNPARTAVTSAALMIGVGLVVFVAVFADGLKASFFDALDRTIKGDLVVTGRNFFPMPRATVDAVQGVEGVEIAAGVRFAEARVDGATGAVYGIDPQRLPQVFAFDWRGGATDEVFDRLDEDGAVVEELFAEERGLSPGERFTATAVGGERATFTVLGIYRDRQLANGGFVVSNAAFERLSGTDDVFFVVAKVAEGADPGAVIQRVKDTLQRQFPAAEARSNAEYKDEVERNVNQLLAILYALLGMSVVISLFGIVNTLVLSITERTREIGMLRAIGVTRRQLRRMIRYESVITSTIGGVLGILVGIVFAYLMVHALEDEGIGFSLPEGQLVVFLIVAILVGVVAAVLPARRAARLNPLDALHYE